MPHFLCDMRSEGCKKDNKCFKIAAYQMPPCFFATSISEFVYSMKPLTTVFIVRALSLVVISFTSLFFTNSLSAVGFIAGLSLYYIIEFPYLVEITEYTINASVVPFRIKFGRARRKARTYGVSHSRILQQAHRVKLRCPLTCSS